jgi:AraC family transcriptional regulator
LRKLLNSAAQTSDSLQAALALKARTGAAGRTKVRHLAQRAGWCISDVICTSGPRDRAFEERHSGFSVAVVAAGTFSYRGQHGRAFMTPGSLLLGNADQCFCCGHEHGEGDRCIAFYYEHEAFERIAADAGARRLEFRSNHVSASRHTASTVAGAIHMLDDVSQAEEVGYSLAAAALSAQQDCRPRRASQRDECRVAETVRFIEHYLGAPHTLEALAARAHLSPYHFLRLFKQAVGASPHQFLLRMRLRAAAQRLVSSSEPVTDIAYNVGFADLSNFTRSFHAELGLSPSRYRKRYR